ncbi:MAG TPA: CBS domain-containing protein [Nocardioidaceae bacterium]|nr:CBS domain-containing protein [Nocardioidaceae bacterium]
MRISEVLHVKGDSVVTIAPESTVRELVALLREHNIGAVVVSVGSGTVSGIVSERDVVRGLADGLDILDRTIGDIMTSRVHTAPPNESGDHLMKLMTDNRIRHVPVVEDGTLHGIVSIGDVVKSRMNELQFERDQLESYVAGSQ